MDVRIGLHRRLSAEELMLLNCSVREDSWESLRLQGDQISQSERKSTLNIHWKDWCWSWSSNTLATDVKNQLIRNDPEAGKDRGKEETGTTQDEMLGWHHWLNGHEFEQTLGDGEGQGSLVCGSTSGCQESVMTEQLSNNKTKSYLSVFVQIYSSLKQNELVTRNDNPL